MPQTTSVTSAIEQHRIASDVPFICLITLNVIDRDTGLVAATLDIARNPEPIAFDGRTFAAGHFDISAKKESGRLAEVTLSVTDYTQEIQARMEAYKGGIGSEVIFYVVNADNLNGPPETKEYFEIVGSSAAEYRFEFQLGAENVLRMPFPRRRQTKDFCQARFKDPKTCKYAGTDTTCDQTLLGTNGCAVKNNTINFRAFPGINANGFRYA